MVLVKKIDKKINAQSRAQKQTPINTVDWHLTEEQTQHNGAKMVSFTDGPGTTGRPLQGNLEPDLTPSQKLTESRSQT